MVLSPRARSTSLKLRISKITQRRQILKFKNHFDEDKKNQTFWRSNGLINFRGRQILKLRIDKITQRRQILKSSRIVLKIRKTKLSGDQMDYPK